MERLTDLLRDTALDGAESKDPEDAYLAHAVRSFSTTEAREQEQALAAIGRSETFPRALLMLHEVQIQVAGDANVNRACMAAENVDVAAGHAKTPAVLVLGPRERPWPARQARALVVEKVRTAWAR